MNIMQNICREYNITPEIMHYMHNVSRIYVAFRNTSVERLESVSDLQNISLCMLRTIGTNLGISNVNSIPTRDLLENRILHAYQCLINLSEDDINVTSIE